MPKPLFSNKQLSSKKLLLITGTAVAVVAFVHVFIAYIVMPLTNNYMRFYLPSKNGGKESYLTLDEFTTIGLSALGITLLFGVAIALLVKFKKISQATTLALILVAGSFIYSCLYIGNGLSDVWGGWWSILGVSATILLGTYLELPLLFSMDDAARNARKKS